MQQGKQGDNVGSCCFACLAERVPLLRFWRDIFGPLTGTDFHELFSSEKLNLHDHKPEYLLCSHIAIKPKLRDNHDVG
jgi:hypothetical protein